MDDDASQRTVQALLPPLPRMVVIGKIILDDYRQPGSTSTTNNHNKIVVGGGGPQAAWGAAACWAVLDYFDTDVSDGDRSDGDNDNHRPQLRTNQKDSDDNDPPPPPQPIAFCGPVGKWTSSENASLRAMLEPAVASIHLIAEPSLMTPCIQLYHNDEQELQWEPLADSWGSQGADSLWRNRPSADDVLQNVLRNNDTDDELLDCLHVISEASETAAGGGTDSQLLQDSRLSDRFRYISVEPIAFPVEVDNGDESSAKTPLQVVSSADAASCLASLRNFARSVDVASPDQYLYEAIPAEEWATSVSVAIAARYGPQGSQVLLPVGRRNSNSNDQETTATTTQRIPVATLQTSDGKPINPTGAGNAYSSAFAAAIAKGESTVEAACIASAIGAIVCEHDHLPPWSWDVLERIASATHEIKSKLSHSCDSE